MKNNNLFHSVNGKRLILIVDDEPINRKILGAVIEQEYEVIYADDGLAAMEIIHQHRDTLSLVLLDLIMPQMSGIEVLRRIRADALIRHIPVIVVTTDQEAEVESLTLGANDFISKPFPRPDVILARLLRTIELSEDRDIIQSTERDQLTQLFNKEYFYQYAQQLDIFHKEREMDAILIDVNHFHMINERYGKEYGDEILRRVGQKIRGAIREEDGIVCRREADAFLVYCVHGLDHEALLEAASIGIEAEDGQEEETQVRLRMGVYACADKSIDIERRFDRAKAAADTIRNNFTQQIAIYDDSLHESELYEEQLTGDFHKGIHQGQFHVYYQPKYNIKGEVPILASAEALVRWIHPDLGLISPGVFIPLFEENGMIRQLDHYVWRETAAQLQVWKDRYGISLPVSVNISRIDMFDENLVNILQGIVDEFGLEPRDLNLEITESAYTDDSERIIETVKRLRDRGFKIEMDDFGTGYSSLGMISNLPIDVLKMDMMFVRNAFSERQDVKMLELILELAEYLQVPVIAEGVETGDQMRALKTMGCDMAQGFYFSKPIPAEEFEAFIEEKIRQEAEMQIRAEDSHIWHQSPGLTDSALHNISTAMTSDYESIYYVDTESGYYIEFGSHIWRKDLQMQKGGQNFFTDMAENFAGLVHYEDQEKVLAFLQRDYLLQRLALDPMVSRTYRIRIDGQAVYYRLQAVRAKSASEDDQHIIIGIRNVNEEAVKAAEEEKAQREDACLCEMMGGLLDKFESVYYVDEETDAYTVFAAATDGGAERQSGGLRFHEDCQHSLLTRVYQADQSIVAAGLRKDVILRELEISGGFSVDYRLMFDGQPVFYRMEGFRPETGDGRHFLIGIRNVDAEKSQRMRFADAEEASATYAQIVQALCQDFFTVYYVNVENDHYIRYSMSGSDHQLQIERTGEDFFGDCVKEIPGRVVPEDRDRLVEAFRKDRLLQDLMDDEKGATSITYQQVRGEEKIHVATKVLRLADDPTHIVLGIRNIEAQVRRKKEYEATMAQSLTWSRIARAISREYLGVYVVDMNTDDYVEYDTKDSISDLPLEASGENFFEETRANILKIVYPQDVDLALSVWDKDKLLPALEAEGVVSATYRLILGDEPVWVVCHVIRMDERDEDDHIIVTLSSGDAPGRR